MKRTSSIVLMAGLAGTLVTGAFVAAGPLNPPVGPVASSFKTLGEVEPRIAVNAINTPGDATSSFKITQPGSYYLTGNVTGASGKNGVTIAASGVTLDLAGFSLLGVAGSLDGVAHEGTPRSARVLNGNVQGWGGDGIDLYWATSSMVEGVTSSDNSGAGIQTGERSRIAGCVSRTNTLDNIVIGGFSQVTDCVADGSAGGHGINASFVSSLVSRCTASHNAMSGIRAAQRTLVQDCVATANTLHGVHITWIGRVEHCYISDNVIDGIRMDGGGGVTIRDNTVVGTSSNVGIRVVNDGSCQVEGNTVTFCQTGIVVATSTNTVVRNTGFNNALNFSVAPGNLLGPTVTPATAGTATPPLATCAH